MCHADLLTFVEHIMAEDVSLDKSVSSMTHPWLSFLVFTNASKPLWRYLICIYYPVSFCSNWHLLPESNWRNASLPMQSVVWHSATYNPLSNHTSHSGDCLHPIYSIWSNNFSMLPLTCHQLRWDNIFRSLLNIASKDLHMSGEQNLAGLSTSTPHLFLWGQMKCLCNFITSASGFPKCSGLN